ncbi:MAG: PQQ-binding-like beta-propeller repeat protein, partial [Gemmatimonadales bacterium]
VHRHAMERITLGQALLSDMPSDEYDAGDWDRTRTLLLDRIDEIERASAPLDAQAVWDQVRPLIDGARAGLDGYPPHHKHRARLGELHERFAEAVSALTVELQMVAVVAPGANMRRTGVYHTEAVRELSGVRWIHEAGGRIRGQPAVHLDTLYYAEAGRYRWDPSYVYAVDLESRATKWKLEAPTRCRSITLVGRRLYASYSDVGSSSYLCAVNTRTGRQEWVFRSPHGSGDTLSHPAVDDTNVYVADRGGNLYALDAASGKEKWRFKGEPMTIDAAPTPSLADGVVYLPGSHHLYAIDASTGTEKWRLNESVADGMVAVDEDMIYFCQRGVRAFSIRERKYVWRFEPDDREGSFRGCPAVADGMVFARDARSVYALDAATGELDWRFDMDQPIDWKVSPIVADSVVYIGTDRAQTGSQESYLYAIDAGTGVDLWSFPVKTRFYGSPPVVHEGVVYFSSAQRLYALH